MVWVLKKGASKQEIDELGKKVFKTMGVGSFNAEKFSSVLVLEEDPLAIQKKLRSEWERDVRR
jgi:hypothetical protein